MPLKAVCAALALHLGGCRPFKTSYRSPTYSSTMVCLAVVITIAFGKIFRKYRMRRRFPWPFRDIAWGVFTIMALEFATNSFWRPLESNVLISLPKFITHMNAISNTLKDDKIFSVFHLMMRSFEFDCIVVAIPRVFSTLLLVSSLHGCKLINLSLLRTPREFSFDACKSIKRAVGNRMGWRTLPSREAQLI